MKILRIRSLDYGRRVYIGQKIDDKVLIRRIEAVIFKHEI